MSTDNARYVAEDVPEDPFSAQVTPNNRVQLTAEIIDAHDPCEGFVDATVSRDGNTMPLTDREVDKQGRIYLPKKKRELYGIEAGDHVEVDIEQVVFR
jgi:AbrB family looped-hinge helix DNA binding protein